MIYLDNNATTIMPAEIKRSMVNWCNRGNPSASYPAAKESRNMMSSFRNYMGFLCNFSACCVEKRDYDAKGSADILAPKGIKYEVIFTSGATESNCTIIHSVIEAYRSTKHVLPHIIISAVEHWSIYHMVKVYEARRIITATYVKPVISGHVLPQDIAGVITRDTCLISIMHANNETGAINNIKKIGEIAHANNIPFHCDAVQTFGKFPLSPTENNVDAFSVSFHKLHGPPGVGVLVVRKDLLRGYNMDPIIFGTQNNGFRGGTENLPGIGASFDAVRYTMKDRGGKNANMLKVKKYIVAAIMEAVPTCNYENFHNSSPAKVVFISGMGADYLPNTILLAVIGPDVCNVSIKKKLEKKRIIVSVGSACNTASDKSSHVLQNMDMPDVIKRGALRISIGDETTMEEANTFVSQFLLTI
jgi:cysteine desulfurase